MENKHVRIQVLGSGCPTCKKLYELTKKAVAEMNLGTEVEYITDIQKIVEMGVMSSPVLAVNGKPVLIGFLPDMEKIKDVITANLPLPSQGNSACCANENACDIKCKPDEKNNTGCSCGGDC